MTEIAFNLGINIDECRPECQKAKENADALTSRVEDILTFKETQLPLQGQMWKDLTSLEKEEFRLRKVGTENIEHYKSNLQKQKEKLRAEQNSQAMTDTMSSFITAISSPGLERSFFLKWLRINLDNLSHEKLSYLRDQYKEKSKASNSNEIKEIDRQLSNSSLGTEHFFREMGQIYEASVSLPEKDPSRQQLGHLPRLCAQLLLDGFPLELVDGDASNIPLRWVSDVLTQLHDLVSPNNKILVITVLGVQSTGKSTLLNTMFGVQFAVSSGRCTRGAFMLLIRISEDMKATLKCDFLLIIDTEGLKSPELAQLDDSYEHDNELATLVVGLSDITIINIAMENSTEMKDILQIVVHAFLRMKEVGKKPKCQFVHQNVSDVSAHDKNLRDRKLLLQQLNEMTQAAAKMEKKEENQSFTDVMDYNPDTGNWYIPGLWNGNPPMAPVNAGYSEAVYELKKNVMYNLEKCETSVNDVVEFCEWITSLWKAVKHENFIFSFRNSLVADAYMRLCTEYGKWEWDFKKAMYSWITSAQTRIKNFGTIAVKFQFSDVEDLRNDLKKEASKELLTWETTLLDKLTDYFKQKEGHIYLVAGYKQEFQNSIKCISKELEHAVLNELTAAAEMRKGQAKLERINEKHTKEIESRVCKLIENCRKKHAKMTEKELDKEFNDMWTKTLTEFEFFKQRPTNIFDSVTFLLWQNMKDKGSHACQELSKKSLTDCGLGPYKCTPEGLIQKATQKIYKYFNCEDSVARAQKLADKIIAACQKSVHEKIERQNNYHDTYVEEILNIIDKYLDNTEMKVDMDFEVSLKQHICAGAARKFQEMHEAFLQKNDPYKCLLQKRETFCTAFKDVFYDRDQCQKKAVEFAHSCLKPAIEDFISDSLGPVIVSEMKTYNEFGTRMHFQYEVLMDLLQKENFSDFLDCTRSYEDYIRQWILNKIHSRLSGQQSTFHEKQLLEGCLKNIKDALTKAKEVKTETLEEFVEHICQELGKKLAISHDAFDQTASLFTLLHFLKDDWVDLYGAEEESATKEDPVTASAKGSKLERFLQDVKLDHHYREKLSMSTILQIDAKAINDEPVKSKTDMIWYFLKRLMMANVTARNMEFDSDRAESSTELNLENLDDLLKSSNSDMLNPLDIITALFLCSDGFVQQELSLKMSMCQFAVPLLLPNCDTNQCTLMLWALRDIVKKYRPKSLSESKGFKEERIVHAEIPMISFVRLGECSLSKSEILNKLLSNSQQYHDTFVHRDMQSGDCPRTISNGLAEITWYLPCGNRNIDIFDEPVAIVNLHGDIASFETQYAFLCQVSSAMFVFFDNFDLDYGLLRKTHQKDKIHLVIDQKNSHFNFENLKRVATKLCLNKSRILVKTKNKNDADFVKVLRESLTTVIEKTTTKTPIEKMTEIAFNLGINIDESPPAGTMWKDLTSLEKEEFRLRKVGTESIEHYKSNLQKQKEKLRAEQNSHAMTDTMSSFITAISSPGLERSFFLKWLQINLDNLSHDKLSDLREQYKRKCSDSENKDEIKEIDRQLSSSSLGTEHFFREMGQIYEASVSLPENNPSRQQLGHLPRLCAQLLLDGFPLELVDGDASNIPLRWVSDVLTQLHDLVSPNNKILVVTVLGVQSTGKSTLLNTMFGVQFAVSSGRCTRGAFMLLIRISEDMKATLKCDFLLIIDTEGLKSPELAQLDDSHEHDNELATLVVGLSDITIINIAMENSTEMKDILQIVVHAFLRMKEVGKKPKCQFVHQNVSDVSAHDKNLRDRKLLLQQLNEMTQAAAKMEKKDKYKSFTDVMDYNPDTGNWYIPGLWNGNPPMAPVNAGYSEAVYELKKNVLHNLEKCETSVNDIVEFCEWITSLWNAVKHENFIFSFRNSLVADAYMRLCTEYNRWEWDFKKNMYTWSANAETRIRNAGTLAETSQEHENFEELLTDLKRAACDEIQTWESKLLNNLADYFKHKEGHVYLVEGYKQEFENCIKGLGKVLQHTVITELTAVADMKQGQADVDRVKEKHTKEIEDRVCKLIENCKRRHAQMTDAELDREFDEMWKKTLNELEFSKQKPLDIFRNVEYHLRQNLKNKGCTYEELSKKHLKECGLEPYEYIIEGRFKQFTHQLSKLVRYEDSVTKAKKLAKTIIAACEQLVAEKVQRKNNYHDTYILEILHYIDDCQHKEEMYFEVSLKQHICANAAREFQEMHLDFLSENDPYRCLNKNKDKFCADFKDLFNERDQCQKKAEEFVERCLKGAVEDYVSRSLGVSIIDKMLTCEEFSTRVVFQCTVLEDLLEKIDICKELKGKLVISKEALDAFMVLNNADKETFAYWLVQSVNEMGQSLPNKLQMDIKRNSKAFM
ncbi:hypothetical protein WMY93_030676 [Mugilogobius chulae]|uniref:VLIG-type G domain-containing protein n=1 Tax=Mugilogobius chulae TaxID=88201 RepID=A0AAW0MKV2_9GOBI